MQRTSFLSYLGALATLVSTAACWDRPDEEPTGSEVYRDGRFTDQFDWDFQRTVTLDLTVAESARPTSGEARVEVRHTVYGGPVLYQGRLGSDSTWARTLSARLPQHEDALTVTVETRQGLVRRTIPVDAEGRAVAVFD